MFHDHVRKTQPSAKIPKLVMRGNGSVDGPDATGTYQVVLQWIEEMPHLKDLISQDGISLKGMYKYMVVKQSLNRAANRRIQSTQFSRSATVPFPR